VGINTIPLEAKEMETAAAHQTFSTVLLCRSRIFREAPTLSFHILFSSLFTNYPIAIGKCSEINEEEYKVKNVELGATRGSGGQADICPGASERKMALIMS
jgi:hypothetical protein